ncbi:unnamed protein product [Ilex paraguariensis]|uniref:Uncharacterized protein n=1 Tax=Ilex paraguariensis TaxID=185542 RepID=A0ABC8UA86_9AQUA
MVLNCGLELWVADGGILYLIVVKIWGLLFRFEHQHVVRYYQAWFETGVADYYGDSSWGSKTAVSSSFSYKDASSADIIGQESKLESTYLYIQMEYCPSPAWFRHISDWYMCISTQFGSQLPFIIQVHTHSTTKRYSFGPVQITVAIHNPAPIQPPRVQILAGSAPYCLVHTRFSIAFVFQGLFFSVSVVFQFFPAQFWPSSVGALPALGLF